MPGKRRRDNAVVLTDPRAIRALAHPARLTVMDRLYGGQVATSTELAKHAGLSPSAMSYHLRALERWGIVERAESAGDARERPWRARGTSLQISSERPRATAAASTALIGTMLDGERRAIADFLAHEDDEPPQWRDAMQLSTGQIEVTAEELGSLNAALGAVVDGYEKGRRRSPAGARAVRFSLLTVPVRS